MLPLSDHFTRQGVKDRLSLRALKYVYSKATYRLSVSESHHLTVQQVGKRSKSCYHYQITVPVKDRLCALQYILSKATYKLSMSESHHFTVYQVGKRSKSCYHHQITVPVKDRQCALKYVLSKDNLLTEYERITPFHSVSSGEKEQITVPLSDHFTRQG